MPVLAFLIMLSIVFYVFYKVKFFRTKDGLQKGFYSSKSSITLGLFVFLFGLNQLLLFDTTTSKIVGIIFLLIGTLSFFQGIKAYKFISQKMVENNN